MKMVLESDSQLVLRNVDASQCPGCPSNLAMKLVMQIVFQVCQGRGQQPVVFGQGCGIGRDLVLRSGIGTHDSACVALKTAMAVRGIDRPVVVVDGDGQLDMGFGDFSGAFQQGHQYVHVVCDNQCYAASGAHATGMTDILARVSTRPAGRVGWPGGQTAVRKQPAMMIMFSGARYAATASPLHVRDFERKVTAALDHMPAFIQVFTPCNVSWGYNDDQAARITRLGVECGIWPLWEWKEGAFRRTLSFDRRRSPQKLDEYLGSQRRYAHLGPTEREQMGQYVESVNQLVDRMAAAFCPDAVAGSGAVVPTAPGDT